MSRLYQPTSLASHTTVLLTESASHHLARVLRAKVGETLTLFNGNGNDYTAVITRIDKKSVQVDITHVIACHTEPPICISLAQGIARGEKMDVIVQKAVELGVTHLYPLTTERGNVRLEREREERRLRHWQSIIISACEQSGRSRLPSIATPQTLPAWLDHVQADQCFVLSPHAQNKLPPRQTINPLSSIALLIGPEGGLSEKEIALAMQKGFLPLNLGPRVLRAETATLAALAALQLQYGDFH